MTNKERISQLGIWDLAEFLHDVSAGATKFTVCENECLKCEYSDSYCTSQIAEWLMAESEEK